MANKMGYYKFHRMSKADKVAFKAAGGKVKLPIFTYIVGSFLVVALMHSCDNKSEAPVEPWQKAQTACMNFVHQKVGGSIFDIELGSNKDAGKNLFKQKVSIKGKNGKLTTTCLATGDGVVKEVGAFQVVIN